MSEPSVHHLQVPRSARYALLGEPGPGVRALWMVLHGYRQLAPRFIRRFRHIARPDLLIAAPEALNRFYVGDAPGRHGPDSKVGGTWMTREDRESEIADYVAYLDRLHHHLQDASGSPVPVVGLGFSQGCHTLARWLGYGEARPATAVFWGEVLPPDLDLDRAAPAFRQARLVSVQGREDRHITPELLQRQAVQLQEMGAEMSIRWHSMGHAVDPDALSDLAATLRTPR